MSAVNKKFRLDDAVAFLIDKGNESVRHLVSSFGDARLPKDSAEREQCQSILDIFSDYVQRKKTSRPLSIAVFGPPGSGKSFTVKELARKAGMEKPRTINLSQLSDSGELSDWLLGIAIDRSDEVPLLFFDEFDTSLKREELGWLRWFLAPMWDSEFVHKGRTVKIPKSVFVFAGGTAQRYEEFEEQHDRYFRNRKGPDFASRLNGFLNIEGLNTHGSDRLLRRAIVLQHQLGRRSESLKGETPGTLKIESDVLKRLLGGGHYIHDARSLEALLGMSTLTNADKFRSENLPSERLMKLHVNRGPLDRMVIGISAGQEPHSKDFFTKLAEELIKRGAVLAYGGNLVVGDTLKSLIEVVEQFPDELIRRDEKRIRNYLAYPDFLNKKTWDARTGIRDCVHFDELDTLSPEELKDVPHPKCYFRAFSDVDGEPYVVENHFAWSLSLFRMRLCLVQEVRALVVVGGKTGDPKNPPWGRFPGVAEEVMLALAFNVPVYVLGMSGGAAREIGSLMGLSRIHEDSQRLLQTPTDDDYKKFSQKLASNDAKFDVPHKPGLPKTFDELQAFFRKQGPDKERWEKNGLSLQENRELFNLDSKEIDRSVELIIRGVTRLNQLQPSSVSDTPLSS